MGFVVLLTLSFACHGQAAPLVGGGCDGCELMFVGMPANITFTDTSAGWTETGQKLRVTGVIYERDGRTPAADVVVYYWQTDSNGTYSPSSGMDERAKRHGHIRGWVKTDASGKYSIQTIRPAPYPNAAIPAHIHVSIKEPRIENEYYIDELVFDDDPLLTTPRRKALENRGGSGILRLFTAGDVQVAEHDIILGLNIPNYPQTSPPAQLSGLSIGEDQSSFIPFHAYGPDTGTRACPVCKYGRYHGIIYFVGNHPSWVDIRKWLAFLEQESLSRGKHLKAYFVYGNANGYSQDQRREELERLGSELGLKSVALTFVPSLSDTDSEINLSRVDPSVENTIVVYRNRKIVDKFVNLKPSDTSFRMVSATLDRTKSDTFNLPPTTP